ncbi:uncharacterized protein LOC121981739 [Zingiber officinale]|uniref:J domain-containing protein n=1 Tax=Zingiber officinale TaxID=94328 RepID=A0A8J5GJZ6_ZINOF|nr:uncharacterized protein LOC121981739 [Zingiber officinale]XP_042390373.1 uncharacterized protein LOC121981739 [Zingiber officinale]KAG6508319.1 hypothetical protein ZIOFF_033693 [Zingiber officinale]
MSKGQYQTRIQSGRRALEKCKSKTIEIIDVEKGENVIIDAPESSHQGSGSLKGKINEIPSVVIHIADEEGENDKLHSNAYQHSSNSRVSPLFGSHSALQELDDEECVMYSKEDLSSSYSSRNGFPPFGSSGTPHVLDSSCSEISSSRNDSSTFNTSGSDDSDFEVEDISGHIHEQWERAALRRKKSQTVRMRSEDQSSVSGSSSDPGLSPPEPTQNMVDLEDSVNKSFFEHSKVSPCKNGNFFDHFKHSQNVDNLEDSTNKFSSEHFKASPSKCGSSRSDSRKNISNMTNGKIRNDPFFGNSRKESPVGSDTSTRISCEVPSFQKNKSLYEGSSLRSQTFETHADLNETNTPDVQMQGSATVSVDGFSCMGKAERSPPGNSPSASAIRDEMDFQYEGPNPGKPTKAMDSKHPMAGCSYNHSEKEYGHSAESQHDNPGLQEINPGAKGMSFVQQIHSFNDPIHDEPVIKHSADLFGYETEAIHGKSTSKNDTENGALCQNLSLHVGMQDLSLSLDNLTGDLEKHNEIVMKPIVPKDQSASISEREKLKESDEYKRAAEEEWAQRNREIQSQAEEAQRLRKRKKAESLRLLDMEKRQKQRVEEIRESQKKDEQTIHLKELIRAEVRKELDKMEWRYRDMASLLRGLGIHVEGGPSPMSHEVNAAYKQALLRFHPDRASRSDIRKQVEAEETFKMISRLKEKLLPAL